MDVPYTFRALRADDTFLMFEIISKIGINEFADCFERDAIKNMVREFTESGNLEGVNTVVGISVMLEMANVVLGNLSRCEKEIFQLLAQVSGMTAKSVKELPLPVFARMVIDFVKKEEFRDFVQVVLESFKLEN